ncbi:MAG: glycosyltransferase family 4 protein [Deltaproteobacteria bacterium]|nr:glycosyltransferase family 4 protein [Deltaproteobacteria bacterium]
MRIGINGRFLVAKKTGVQRAAYNLIRALVSLDQENEYFLFTSHEELSKPEWQRPNVHVIPSGIMPGHTVKNILWEQLTLPFLARRYRVDLLHSPANMAPLFYRGHSVVHIHDVCFVVNPQWYSFAFRTWYTWIIPRLARKAARVITNSNNSRNDLLQFCRLSVRKVSMVYWAVEDSFLNNSSSQGEDWPEKDYILYVGSLEPRKNIRTLVEAFQQLRRNHPELRTKLILIGGESPLFAEIKLNIVDFKDDIELKGFVDDPDLRGWYRNARLVAYPSLYEGFGMPPLEAMASGVPVVTSSTSSLPEVVGDAALKVNPCDVTELSEAMGRLLQDEELRTQMAKAGYHQVRNFNWFRVARNILAVYYEVCQKSRTEDTEDGEHQSYIPMNAWHKLIRMEEERIRSFQSGSDRRGVVME